MDNLTVKIEGEQKEIIVREGEALRILPPKPLALIGRIDSVLNFLFARKDTFDPKKAHILVNYDKLSIMLVTDERNVDLSSSVNAELQLSEHYKRFGINGTRTWESLELSKFIKMNRAFFVSKDEAANLVSVFKHFKVQVEKTIEKTKEQSGSFDEKKHQAVQSNIPASFKIKIPIFKGEEDITFEVETEVDPTNFNITLISPDANEFVQSTSRDTIDKQIKSIVELCPEIAIIYQ